MRAWQKLRPPPDNKPAKLLSCHCKSLCVYSVGNEKVTLVPACLLESATAANGCSCQLSMDCLWTASILPDSALACHLSSLARSRLRIAAAVSCLRFCASSWQGRQRHIKLSQSIRADSKSYFQGSVRQGYTLVQQQAQVMQGIRLRRACQMTCFSEAFCRTRACSCRAHIRLK